ncbi:unnamed protein product [Musa banksii]
MSAQIRAVGSPCPTERDYDDCSLYSLKQEDTICWCLSTPSCSRFCEGELIAYQILVSVARLCTPYKADSSFGILILLKLDLWKH